MDGSGSSLSDEGGPAGSPLQVHVRPLHGQIFTIEVGANFSRKLLSVSTTSNLSHVSPSTSATHRSSSTAC